MQVLQREVDGHRHRTSKVHLTAPKEFFFSSPALLHSVHCLMCPILPERERKSSQPVNLDFCDREKWKTRWLFNYSNEASPLLSVLSSWEISVWIHYDFSLWTYRSLYPCLCLVPFCPFLHQTLGKPGGRTGE